MEVAAVAQRDTIVVGASAGGVEALRSLVRGLPADLPATVAVVLHTAPSGVNALAAILARATPLKVRAATGEESLERGTVLVARPDHHLVVIDGRAILTRGPRENGHRPAVDVLFRSAARARGPRVIGVVLSGALDDGSAGLVAIRSRGGLGVVQDPDDAISRGMPENAVAAAGPEHVVPLSAMPELLAALVRQEVTDDVPPPSDLMDTEVALAALEADALNRRRRPGEPAGLSCPDCHGTLFTIREGGYVRYRCRVGHAWSSESLLARQDSALEGALWMALRALEEKAALAETMATRADAGARPLTAGQFHGKAAEAAEAAELVRRMLLSGSGVGSNQEPVPSEAE